MARQPRRSGQTTTEALQQEGLGYKPVAISGILGLSVEEGVWTNDIMLSEEWIFVSLGFSFSQLFAHIPLI